MNIIFFFDQKGEKILIQKCEFCSAIYMCWKGQVKCLLVIDDLLLFRFFLLIKNKPSSQYWFISICKLKSFMHNLESQQFLYSKGMASSQPHHWFHSQPPLSTCDPGPLTNKTTKQRKEQALTHPITLHNSTHNKAFNILED